jgi:hypothetical protein
MEVESSAVSTPRSLIQCFVDSVQDAHKMFPLESSFFHLTPSNLGDVECLKLKNHKEVSETFGINAEQHTSHT